MVFAGVERDLLAHQPLQLPADKLRDQHLIFKCVDLQSDFFIKHAIEKSADFGDHDSFTQ